MSHFLYSFITFIIALFFIVLGFLGILIQTSDTIRSEVIGFIIEDTLLLSIFGFAFVLVGIAIVFYLLASLKKRYYKIKSSESKVYFLDEQLFQNYLKTYWKQLFPQHTIPSQVLLKRNKIQVIADLPYVPENQQKALIQRIDQDLKDLFHRVIGYKKKYIISISFQPEASTLKK